MWSHPNYDAFLVYLTDTQLRGSSTSPVDCQEAGIGVDKVRPVWGPRHVCKARRQHSKDSQDLPFHPYEHGSRWMGPGPQRFRGQQLVQQAVQAREVCRGCVLPVPSQHLSRTVTSVLPKGSRDIAQEVFARKRLHP